MKTIYIVYILECVFLRLIICILISPRDKNVKVIIIVHLVLKIIIFTLVNIIEKLCYKECPVNYLN